MINRLTIHVLAALLMGSARVQSEPIWVAVGYGGRRISSLDGQTWQHDQRWADESKDNDDVLVDVAYGRPADAVSGRFVAVGGGALTGHLLSTTDGRVWTALGKVKGRVATIAFGAGRFVAARGGELLSSTDGETFTAGEKLAWTGSIHARKSAFGDGEAGGMFVIIGDADLSGVQDRVSWRAVTADGVAFAKAEHHTAPARDIAYGSGHFVVVGPRGLIESSHDGVTWIRQTTDDKEDFRAVLWTGSRFLAQGNEIWSSPDGMTWNRAFRHWTGDLAWADEESKPPAPLGLTASWGGTLHVTRDWTNWTKAALPPGPSINAVAKGER